MGAAKNAAEAGSVQEVLDASWCLDAFSKVQKWSERDNLLAKHDEKPDAVRDALGGDAFVATLLAVQTKKKMTLGDPAETADEIAEEGAGGGGGGGGPPAPGTYTAKIEVSEGLGLTIASNGDGVMTIHLECGVISGIPPGEQPLLQKLAAVCELASREHGDPGAQFTFTYTGVLAFYGAGPLEHCLRDDKPSNQAVIDQISSSHPSQARAH